MRDIVTAQEMKDLDRNTIENAGVLSLVLMERAALKTVEEMKKRWKQEDREKVLVVCGSGNNGGDGLAIARLLHLQGISVSFYFPGKEEKMTPETAKQMEIARNYEVPQVHNLNPGEYTTI